MWAVKQASSTPASQPADGADGWASGEIDRQAVSESGVSLLVAETSAVDNAKQGKWYSALRCSAAYWWEIGLPALPPVVFRCVSLLMQEPAYANPHCGVHSVDRVDPWTPQSRGLRHLFCFTLPACFLGYVSFPLHPHFLSPAFRPPPHPLPPFPFPRPCHAGTG